MKTILVSLALSAAVLMASPAIVRAQSADRSVPAAQLKSIHLFDMPEGVTEADLAALFNEMNTAIERLGYKGAGYTLYKVADESTEKYRYFFEGVWPDAEAYRKIHEDKMYMNADKKADSIIRKIRMAELYRRLVRVQ